MNRLSKKRAAAWEAVISDLQKSVGDTNEAIETFNETSESLWSELEEAICKFNDGRSTAYALLEESKTEYETARDEAKTLAEEYTADMENFADEKSDRWQESERGEAYRSDFIGEWQNVDIKELDLEGPEEVTCDQPEPLNEIDNAADDLEELPTEFEF